MTEVWFTQKQLEEHIKNFGSGSKERTRATSLTDGFKMNETDISNTIAIEYQRDLNKPELINFKMLVKQSRKFGFPIICTLKGKSHQEHLSAAAALLVEVAGAWPREGVPADLKVEEGTPLHNDAKWLLEHTLSPLLRPK